MGVYTMGYAKLGTSKCKGPKPCSGTKIPKGSLRFGTQITIAGNTSWAWRHYGCITSKQFENLKADFEEPDEVDGFEELTPEDQEKFRKAYAQGHVDDEDIPDSARKEPELDEEGNPVESPKKGRGKAAAKGKGGKKKKDEEAEAEGDDAEEEEVKPKKKAPAKKRAAKKAESEEEGEDEETEKPKKRAPAKKRAAKKEPEPEVEDDDEEEEEEKPKKKATKGRKPPAKRQKKEQSADEDDSE
ncbi:hypothetical protein JCM8202_004123 [Rhodotorula sphaerocarpa]